jgi:secretion/DNA translocation related TadE-like protein
MNSRDHADGGFATVWVVIAMAVVVLAGGISAAVGVVAAQRHKAGAAADASAIAAALASIDGPTAACHQAMVVASMDGAAVVSCHLLGAVSEVSVSIRLPGPLAPFGTAYAHARAGPATRPAETIPTR